MKKIDLFFPNQNINLVYSFWIYYETGLTFEGEGL